MAAGDKYIDCTNNNLGTIPLLKSIVGIDANGNPFFNRVSSSGGGSPVDPDADAFFARLPDALTDEQKALYTSFFIGIKNFNGLNSISEGADYMYFFGGLGSEDNAKVNGISSLFPVVVHSGTPTWANTGFTGGSGIALKNGYADTVNASAFKLQDGFMCVYVSTEGIGVNGGTEIELGNWVDDNSAINSSIAARYNGLITGQLNAQNTSTEVSAVIGSAIGLSSITKIGTKRILWRNGDSKASSLLASLSLCAFENYILAILYGAYGSVIRNSTKEVYFVIKGRASFIDQSDLNYRIGLLRSNTVWTAKTPLGYIFNDSFARGSTGSAYTNSGAFSCNGSNLIATNTGGGEWDKTLSYTNAGYKSTLLKSIQTLYVTVDSLASKGVAIGYSGIYWDFQVRFRFDTEVIEFRNTEGTVLLSASSDTLNLSVNDVLQITVRNHNERFVCSVYNVNTDTTLTFDYQYSYLSPITTLAPGYYNPILYATGGTQNISLWSFYSNADKNADICFVGDSNFWGFFADYQENKIVNRVGLGLSYNNYSAPSIKTADVNFNEIANLRPQKVVLMLGTNDVYNGVAEATSIANLTAGVAILEAAGATVHICKIPPIIGISVVSYNTALVTAFGLRVDMDLYTPFAGGTNNWNVAYTSDFIHINSAGQVLAANEITANL